MPAKRIRPTEKRVSYYDYFDYEYDDNYDDVCNGAM